MDKVIDFINVNRDRYLEELKAFLAIPSISALPQHAARMVSMKPRGPQSVKTRPCDHRLPPEPLRNHGRGRGLTGKH